MNEHVLDAINRPQFNQALSSEMLTWDEPPFLRFIDANSTKVISKLNTALTHEDQRDVALELFAARALIIAGCNLTYEPDSRGPDFEVSKNGVQFFCEVKRFRETTYYPVEAATLVDFPPLQYRKLGDTLCKAILQVKTGCPNVVYMRSDKFTLQKCDLQSALASIKHLSDKPDLDFFLKHGFTNLKHFYYNASFMSAIVFDDRWNDSTSNGTTVQVLVNEEAANPLPSDAVDMLRGAFAIPFKKLGTSGGA